jgi:hypothetical protein
MNWVRLNDGGNALRDASRHDRRSDAGMIATGVSRKG